MTAATLAGDLAENGLSVSNAVVFDIVPALPALSWLRQNSSVMLLKVFIRMPLIHGGATDIAKQCFKRGLKQTAKVEAKRDALGRVAF